VSIFGQEKAVLGPVVGAFGEMSVHVDFLANIIAGALTADCLSCYGDRNSKTAKAFYC
jgi:hypothetical protein